MNQRIGREAQDEFKLRCSQAHISCNPSQEDDHGWDFFVEIPMLRAEELPADKHLPNKQILVQVKSTRGKSTKTSMKVSNALKLAGNELPCFVVLFQYIETAACTRIYAAHYWNNLIERALRRGRTASAKGTPVHRVTMTINFSEFDDHTDDLLSWLISTVRAFPETYPEDKRRLYETVGYVGARNYLAKVTFGPLKGIEDLVDHHLELTESLPVERITLIDSRFGIEAPEPLLESTSGKMQFRPTEPEKGTLVLQALSGAFISLPCEARYPVIPGLPEDRFKLSITTWMLKIIISHTEGIKLLTTVDLNTKLPLERLIDLSRFFSWEYNSICITFRSKNISPISFDIIASSEENTATSSEFVDIAEMLFKIQSRSGGYAGDFSLLDLAKSWKELKSFFLILYADDMRLRISPDPPYRPWSELCCATGYFDFDICGITFMVLFETDVTVENTGRDNIDLIFGSRILRECFVGGNGEDVRAAGRECYVTKERAYDDNYIDLGDIRHIFEK